MPEEIKVVVREVREGSALKDVARDADALTQKASIAAPGGGGGGAPRQPDRLREEAAAFISKGDAQAAAKERAERRRAREQAAVKAAAEESKEFRQGSISAKHEAIAARAAGDTEGAAKLELEAKILARSAALQKSLVLDKTEAKKLATEQVEAETKIAAAKAAQVTAEKAAKTEKTEGVKATKAQVVEAEKERVAVARAQDAAANKQMSALARIGKTGLGMAEGVAGATGLGGLTSALGAGSGATAAATAATATAIILAVLRAEAGQQHEMKMLDLGDVAARAKDERTLRTLSGPDGTSASARSAARESMGEAKDREAAKAGLEEAAKPKWYKPTEFGRWLHNATHREDNQMMTAEGELAIRENAEAQARAVERARREREVAKRKYAEDEGVLQQAQEKKLNYDPRGARDLEHQVLALHEYNRLIKENATEAQAMRGAEMAVQGAERTENARFGRLVNARSGAGDVARAAALATGEVGGRGGANDAGVRQAMDALRETVRNNHRDAMSAGGGPKDIRG